MTRAPLVSVIVPTYNRAEYLAETIDSVLAQDHGHIEVIVVDDGSTDATADVLAPYADRITVLRQANRGQAHAVNAGLAEARGEYLTLVSDDDPLLPEALGVLVEVLETDLDALVAYPDWYLIDSDGEVCIEMPGLAYSLADMVRYHLCLPGPCTLFRRRAVDLVGGWDPRWRWVADYDFWMRIGLHGPMVRVPRVLATWRRHASGATTATPRVAMAREQVEVVAAFFARDDLPADIRALEAEAMGTAYMVAAHVALEGTHTVAGQRFDVRDRMAPLLERRVRRVGETKADTSNEIIQWQASELHRHRTRTELLEHRVELQRGEIGALERTIDALRDRLGQAD